MQNPTESAQSVANLAKQSTQESGKVLHDSVHGSIEFHPLLVKIIDTPAFQRLRDITQLGVTNLVFHSAGHRRFEHSLGVCYLAWLMLDSLERNSPDEMKDVRPEEKLCVLIAGLCHDLGHGPFSHVWENFLGLKGKKFQHEQTSVLVLEQILNENKRELRKEFQKYGLGDPEIKLIGDLILGNDKNLPPEKKFLCEIVANKINDIDVDKWDYFLRDGEALGIGVTFDYKRLLKFTKLMKDKDGHMRISFRDKEKFSLEDMFRMRAELHTRAYQHPVTKKIEVMLVDALLEADQHYEFTADGQSVKLSESHGKIPLFAKMDDSIRNDIKRSDNPNLKNAKEIFDRIDRRRLYDEVATFNVKYPDQAQPDEESPKGVPADVFSKITKDVRKQHNVTIRLAQILITLGKYRSPINQVTFYSKGLEKTSERHRQTPQIKYDLPFSKIKIYSRDKLDDKRKKDIRRYCFEKLKDNKIDVEDDEAPPT